MATLQDIMLTTIRALTILSATVAWQSAAAQSSQTLELCQELASSVSSYFRSVQLTLEAYRANREETLESLRQFAYEQYKTNVARDGPGSAVIWDVKRRRVELGIQEFVRTPTATPLAVERRVFTSCASLNK